MDRTDELEFLKEFKEKVDEYLFLGLAPSEGLVFTSNESKQMREARKNPQFQKLYNSIRDMIPQSENILRKYNIDYTWFTPTQQQSILKYPLLNLILENETYMNIEKNVFLDRINEAIDTISTESGKGVVLTCLSVKSDSDVTKAVIQAGQDYGLHPQEVNVDTLRITNDILESVKFSEFFIVDVTYKDPLIYFLVGYARGVGVTPLCIAKRGSSIIEMEGFPVTFFDSFYELRRQLGEYLMRENRLYSTEL